MKSLTIRTLLIAVVSIAGGIVGALSLGASVASASGLGPLMPIVVAWPTSGPVHVGQQVTIEANCPVLTTTPNGAPVFDSIVTLKLGAKVLWRLPTTPPKAPQAPQECVPTGGGGCGWPNTGVCVGSYINQTPAVFEITMPLGAETGQIVGIDTYGDVISEGKVTVFGSHPQLSQPTTTVPTGTTPTTTTTTKPAKPTSPKTTTTHVPSPTHLPWWRSLWRRVLSWF